MKAENLLIFAGLTLIIYHFIDKKSKKPAKKKQIAPNPEFGCEPIDIKKLVDKVYPKKKKKKSQEVEIDLEDEPTKVNTNAKTIVLDLNKNVPKDRGQFNQLFPDAMLKGYNASQQRTVSPPQIQIIP